ncbi:MAG: hypothetical protein KIT56_11445 [Gammaproteobacteria bacterium]|nr:hypothetical protein [Gammaproteobacteria bacterium]MCW5584460.1 hypothetical protein [Gammaproteobacteria bacterium]
MIGWIARFLLVLAGFFTSLFVVRDTLNFEIIKMVIAVFLFTLIVAIAAFWPMLVSWFRGKRQDKNTLLK